jgi:hypothetical protein
MISMRRSISGLIKGSLSKMKRREIKMARTDSNMMSESFGKNQRE